MARANHVPSMFIHAQTAHGARGSQPRGAGPNQGLFSSAGVGGPVPMKVGLGGLASDPKGMACP